MTWISSPILKRFQLTSNPPKIFLQEAPQTIGLPSSTLWGPHISFQEALEEVDMVALHERYSLRLPDFTVPS